MNLFIESPQQAAERRARLRESPGSWDGSDEAGGSSLFDGRDGARRVSDEAGAGAPLPRERRGKRDAGADAARTTAAEPAQNATPAAASAAKLPFSQAQHTYQEEIAYDRRRTRRRALGVVVRTLAFVVLLPLLLIAAFLISYAVTCILNGASPEELAQQMGLLFERAEGFARDLWLLLGR